MNATPNTQPIAVPTSIEQMCSDARKRLAAHINRSVGQHRRAMRESANKAVKS